MINFGGRKKKTTFCDYIFDIYPYVLIQIFIRKAPWMQNLIMHPTSTHTAYFWQTLPPPKQEILEKCDDDNHHVFSGISCFWGSGVRQKYAVWVLVGCGIKFRIQRALPIEIWVKTQGDMSKIRTQNVVFFFLPPKLINIILLF